MDGRAKLPPMDKKTEQPKKRGPVPIYGETMRPHKITLPDHVWNKLRAAKGGASAAIRRFVEDDQ